MYVLFSIENSIEKNSHILKNQLKIRLGFEHTNTHTHGTHEIWYFDVYMMGWKALYYGLDLRPLTSLESQLSWAGEILSFHGSLNSVVTLGVLTVSFRVAAAGVSGFCL